MPKVIKAPTIVKPHGNIPKVIKEYVGGINTQSKEISIAHMQSPSGWTEPGQRPEFSEYTLVLKGCLHVKTEKEILKIQAGQAIIALPGEWIQYSTPDEGAEYIAICLPAFSPKSVHRDDE